MRFERKQRVIYAQNPLNQVACQLHFSPLLALSAQLPVEFQAAIRKEYPNLSLSQGFAIQFAAGSSPTPPSSIPENYYNFSSGDGACTAQLTKDSLLLASTAYDQWENFRERWATLFAAFLNVYGPISALRLGLRYQDIVDREVLGISGPWSKWINREVLGVLADDSCADATNHQTRTVLPLPSDVGYLQLQTGLVQSAETKQLAFSIDADFYADSSAKNLPETTVPGICGRLDLFNREAGGLFRWCISDALHAALGPKEIA